MFQIRIALTAVVLSTATLGLACSAGDDAGEGDACPGCTSLPVRSGQVDENGSDPDPDASAPPSNGMKPSGPVTTTGADASTNGGGFSVGSVRCGSATCTGATPVCCATFTSATCIAKGGSCSSLSLALECDQAGDCAAGTVCCVDLPATKAHCTARSACSGDYRFEACATDADCANGDSCKASSVSDKLHVCK